MSEPSPSKDQVNQSVSIGEIGLFFTPLVVGFASSYIWPVGPSAGQAVPARPPPWVFGVTWTILYLIIGFIWVWIRRKMEPRKRWVIDLLMILTLTVQLGWTILYGRGNKRGALYMLVVTLLVGLSTMLYLNGVDFRASMLFTTYVTWLIFATMLNFAEVNKV